MGTNARPLLAARRGTGSGDDPLPPAAQDIRVPLIDLGPTILALAGLPPPANADGRPRHCW
jgi:arylsulfatase A-like enzyme